MIATIHAMRQLIGAFIMMPLPLIGSLLGGAALVALIAFHFKWAERRPRFLKVFGLSLFTMVLTILTTLALVFILLVGGLPERWAFPVSVCVLSITIPLVVSWCSDTLRQLSIGRRARGWQLRPVASRCSTDSVSCLSSGSGCASCGVMAAIVDT